MGSAAARVRLAACRLRRRLPRSAADLRASPELLRDARRASRGLRALFCLGPPPSGREEKKGESD
eukprot:2671458-Pyramimonas_sp.AAC.1